MSVLSKITILINKKPFKSFQHISIFENLYGIDRFEISSRYDALEELDGFLIEKSKDFLGFPIVIQTKIKVKDVEEDGINFQGYITEIQSSRSGMSDYDQIIISGGSKEIVLNRKATNKAFIDKTLDEIVKEVLKDYEIKTKIKARNKQKFPYIVQFEESDLEFLKRLSIRYGEWFFFNGKELIFGELPVVERFLTIGYNLEDFRYELRVNPVKFNILSLDSLNMDVHNYQAGKSKIESNLNTYGKHALKMSKELYSNEGKDYYEHLNVDEKDYKKGLEQVGEMQESVDAVNLTNLSGNSTNGFLSAGVHVKINCIKQDGKSRMDYGKYIVTSIQHSIENTLIYKNNFSAIPAETTIPENTDPYFVRTTSNQLGMIADNKDPKKLGRVKVNFWWMEGNQASPWIKVASPYTSGGSGFYFIPSKGTRVLIAFEGGNVEKPYCLGTLYDEASGPDKAWAGNKDDSNAKIHAIRTTSGQTIELHDDSGNEKIRIYDTGGKNEITLDSAKGEITIKATNKLSIESQDKLSIHAKEIEIKADSGLKIEAGQKLEQKGMDIIIDATEGAVNISSTLGDLKASGMKSAEISSTAGITSVKGMTVKLN